MSDDDSGGFLSCRIRTVSWVRLVGGLSCVDVPFPSLGLFHPPNSRFGSDFAPGGRIQRTVDRRPNLFLVFSAISHCSWTDLSTRLSHLPTLSGLLLLNRDNAALYNLTQCIYKNRAIDVLWWAASYCFAPSKASNCYSSGSRPQLYLILHLYRGGSPLARTPHISHLCGIKVFTTIYCKRSQIADLQIHSLQRSHTRPLYSPFCVFNIATLSFISVKLEFC